LSRVKSLDVDCVQTVIDLCVSCVLTTFNKDDDDGGDDDKSRYKTCVLGTEIRALTGAC